MKILLEENELSIPNYLPLRDYQIEEKYHIVDLGAGKDYKRLRLDQNSLKVFESFLDPNTPKQVAEETGLPVDDILNFCQSLQKEGLLKPHQSTPNKFERYSRHLQYYGLCGLNPNTSQEKLSTLNIALIGVGGIGNWVGLNLLGLGVKIFKLIDPDIIEESNLPREILFNENDIGKFKVEAAAREFKKRNQNIQIEQITEKVTADNIFHLVAESDFVILSADKPFFQIQKWTNIACLEQKTPLLNVGYAAEEGVMGPLVIPGISSCLSCNNQSNEKNYHLSNGVNNNPFNEHFIAPSFVCLNSLISSMASYEIVKYFLSFGDCITIDHLVRINPSTFSLNKILNKRDPECTACKHLQ